MPGPLLSEGRHYKKVLKLEESESALKEMPSLEGGAGLGQATHKAVAISILGRFQGSAKVIANQIPFQAEHIDLQRSLRTDISVILGA